VLCLFFIVWFFELLTTPLAGPAGRPVQVQILLSSTVGSREHIFALDQESVPDKTEGR
jgi:hypothetical protein